jgi:hypothetical protein
MKLVWQWVAVVITAYVLGIVGWCFTGAVRRDYPEPVDVISSLGLFVLAVGGLVGGLVYVAQILPPHRPKVDDPA